MDLFHIINSMEPWMIPIIVMIFVTLIVAITTTGGVIKAKLKQNSSATDLSQNKEFLEALREFKETMERRVANLEAIVTHDELPVKRSEKQSIQKTGSANPITDIEMDDFQDENRVESGNSKLKNMLNQ